MSRFCVQIGWDDVPHLTSGQKREMMDAYPIHEQDARARGVPMLGSGRIYPVDEKQIIVEPFDIPLYWPRAYGLDVGWNRTAAIWGAWDRDSDVVYLTSEHYMGAQPPQVHADSIRQRGAWMWGAIDPASAGASQADGKNLLDIYRDMQLNLVAADNSVEAGILAVYRRLTSGRLKVFRTLPNWLREFRIYRRDEHGKVVKENDHAMDGCVVGATLVDTASGPIGIKELAGTSGVVISRDGTMARYVDARLTIRDAPVVTLEFDGGATVTCTYDHPFLTDIGWVKAVDMLGVSCYNGIAQRIQARQWKSRLYRTRVSSFVDAAITYAGSISREMAFAFTGLYGNPQAENQFQTNTTFTMPMATGQTISHTISSSKREGSTYLFTQRGTAGLFHSWHLNERRNGMVAMRVANGTGSITSGQVISCTKKGSSHASIAARDSLPRIPGATDSALTTAGRNRVIYLALTMRNAIAWCAARVSWLIATSKSNAARESALVRCLAIKDAGKADVYCLTVPGISAFCVAGGLVVHNTRYLIMTGLKHATTEPMGDEEFDRVRHDGRSSVTGY